MRKYLYFHTAFHSLYFTCCGKDSGAAHLYSLKDAMFKGEITQSFTMFSVFLNKQTKNTIILKPSESQ